MNASRTRNAIVWLLAAAACAQPQLRYVAVVTRHGVRSPTWAPARLNEFSASPWPDFGVAPGQLTAHGGVLMKILGAYYHERFAEDHLLSPERCSDAAKIFIWADTEQRTIETGRALAESILDGCGLKIHFREQGKDPLFSGFGEEDPRLASDAVRVRIAGDPKRLLTEHQAALDTLQFILDAGQAARQRLVPFSGDLGILVQAKGIELQGPLAAASSLSEDLLLEYAEGMQGSSLGWGRLTRDNLFQSLELHRVYSDLMRRTPYLARKRGSNLLAHVLASLEQAVSRTAVPGALGPPSTSLLILAGHDTNLSNLSGMLGLSWTLPGYQPDETPPGGALLFSLWEDSTKRRFFVRTEYLAASLEQMRDTAVLTNAAPPLRYPVAIPGCEGSDRCSWEAFQKIAGGAIDPGSVDFRLR